MNSSERMNNDEMQQVFRNVMNNLPQDMRLPQTQTKRMEQGFMKISKSLQEPLERMIESASADGKLSAEAQNQFTADLMRIFVPYMRQMTEDIVKDAEN